MPRTEAAAGEERLRAVADRLYGTPAAEFTAERTAAAKRARADGDRDLAARIGALPKPSTAAALLNALTRSGADDLQRVRDLGATLRTAQEHGDRDRLRELGGERRALLTEVVERAVALSGVGRPGAAVLEEVRTTLQAALQSDDAAHAVGSGRLVRSLAVEDLEPAGPARAVALPGVDPDPVRRGRPQQRRPLPGDRRSDPDDGGRRGLEARRRAAERVAEAASAAAARAAEAADRARDARRVAEEDLDVRAAAADRLRAGLEALRRELDDAERDLRAARSASEAAGAAAARAAAEAGAAAAEARRRREEVDPMPVDPASEGGTAPATAGQKAYRTRQPGSSAASSARNSSR